MNKMGLEQYKGVYIYAQQVDNELSSIAFELIGKAKELAKDLEGKVVEVKIKTGEGGKIFGSVSTKEIAAAAKEQIGFALDKKKMQLEEPIRSLGYHDVPIRLHTKVTGTLRVKVTEE